MAGDWIKMRTDLYRDPKVCVMADALMDSEGDLAAHVNQICQRDMAVTRNVMRNVTVGALVAVWGVMRHRGKRDGDDLIVHGITISVLDDIADLPGFGDAMLTVGWAVENSESLVFPRFFEEFNADPAEQAKKKNAERQRRHREQKRNVTSRYGNVTVTHREEKRREETNTPLPPKGETGGATTPTDDYNDPPPPANLASKTFPEFWSLFPRKEHEKTCKTLWRSLIGNHPRPQTLVAEIIAAVKRWLPVWSGRMPDKIPTPASWLEGERWKDELPTKAQATETEYKPMGKGPRICDDD